MDQIVFMLGQTPVTMAALMAGLSVVAVVLLLVILAALLKGRGVHDSRAADAQKRAQDLEAKLSEMGKLQAEMTGRMQTMAEVFGSRQADMTRAMSERFDSMSHKIGQSMTQTSKNTHDHLTQLHERLAVIDTAQKNITSLTGQVVELQHILSNKQTRGAFGQGRMEAIIQDGLQPGGYSFQTTLSNGKRPDCVIHLPHDAPVLVVDAKFPLEGWNGIRNADSSEEDKAARAQFRQDVQKHIKDIAERYFIPGETQDTAFLFVPSESIFADLNEQFEDLVQKAHRSRIVIVSPSLLLLSIQVIQSVLRDAQMREQAHLIQAEVIKLMDDVGRLDDRVRKLQSHFNMTTKDIDQILISTDKVVKRGRKIEALDVGDDQAPEGSSVPRDLLAGE
ncbi:DNA recombination protein RmuC [Coralliovum pocilloporae]|uniref:DNA recombination protein RmuC n=1 Tax=Coralliovum pocilloporae TaxID=3066369 RepID=UPI003306FA3B